MANIKTTAIAATMVAAIVSLRNLPLTAEYGASAIFFLSMSAIFFFVPSALITAELAASLPEEGGAYLWTKAALGKKVGFMTLWVAWMESITWFPAILIFTATMLAHFLSPIWPNLLQQQGFILATTITIFWSATILNFFGIRFATFFNLVGVSLGTLLPGILIIGLGIWWIFSGQDLQINFNATTLIPKLGNWDNYTILAGTLLSFAGAELIAFHVHEAKSPQRSYPRAIAAATITIVTIYMLGTIAIAIVVPKNQISLASGVIQALQVFLANFNFPAAVPLIALCLFLGSIAGVNAWIAGPAKGMLAPAKDGLLPKYFEQTNNAGVPTRLLLTQAIIGTIITVVFFYYIDNNDTMIWLFVALSFQFSAVQYILIYLSAILLRKQQPNLKRAFKTPALNLVAGIGILVCLFCFLMSFRATETLHENISLSRHLFMLLGTFVVLLIPAAFCVWKKELITNKT